jgi:hypothetical protein
MGRGRGLAAKCDRGRTEAAEQKPGDISHQHTTKRGENEETGVRRCDVEAVAPARGSNANQVDAGSAEAASCVPNGEGDVRSVRVGAVLGNLDACVLFQVAAHRVRHRNINCDGAGAGEAEQQIGAQGRGNHLELLRVLLAAVNSRQCVSKVCGLRDILESKFQNVLHSGHLLLYVPQHHIYVVIFAPCFGQGT